MLPEFAEAGAAEAAIRAWLAWRSGNELGEVGFDKSFNRRAGAPETVQTQQLVGDELVIGRRLERQELAQESDDWLRPRLVMVPTTGVQRESGAFFEPIGAKLIKASFADFKLGAGR